MREHISGESPAGSGLSLAIRSRFPTRFPVQHSEFFHTVTPGTGLHPRPPNAEGLRRYFPQIADPTTHDPLLYAPREGETITEIHERAVRFLNLLIDHVDTSLPDVKTVLLVSHAATVITLGRALSGDREKDVRAGTCSLSYYERVREDRQSNRGLGEWACRLNGSTQHLKQGEEVSAALPRGTGVAKPSARKPRC